MDTTFIEFRQSRNFGEVMNASFAFLRQNWRSLAYCLLCIAGPFALLGSAGFGFFVGLSTAAARNSSTTAFVGEAAILIIASLLVLALAAVAAMATVYHFLLLYAERAPITVGAVWARARRDLGMLLLAGIGYYVIVLLGFLLLIVPGIYLSIALLPVFVIQVVERIGFFAAVSRCFKLMAGCWWRTVGVVFVMNMVSTVCFYAVAIPLQLIGSVGGLLAPSNESSLTTTLPFVVLTGIAVILSFVLGSALQLVAITIHYFSLVEEKEGLGLMAKIQSLGTVPVARDEEEEQY